MNSCTSDHPPVLIEERREKLENIINLQAVLGAEQRSFYLPVSWPRHAPVDDRLRIEKREPERALFFALAGPVGVDRGDLKARVF